MNNIDIPEIIDLYKNQNKGILFLCKKYHAGKIKIRKILRDNNILIKNKGKQPLKEKFVINDFRTEKYLPKENKHYIAVCKIDNTKFNDYKNLGGKLTSYIKNNLGIQIPPLYKRRKYYMIHGDYWYEQWFDIIEVDDKPVKKCPYCRWQTTDINNNSGAFQRHLKNVHNISKFDYLKEYPNDKEYFTLANKTENRAIETNTDKYVICEICGKKLSRIDWRHLNKHNITLEEYKKQYNSKTICNSYHQHLSKTIQLYNENSITKSFSSKYEHDICNWLEKHNIEYIPNDRKILKGKELDIYIPSKKIAIEFNGLKWHGEKNGKTKFSHLNKTIECEKQGISLIHIFEDEYVNDSNNIFNELENILYDNAIEITNYKSLKSDNHILRIEAYNAENIVGYMEFKEINKNVWNIVNYKRNILMAENNIINYFIEAFSPKEIIMISNRNWNLIRYNNCYLDNNFTISEIMLPNYYYYNSSINKYKRFLPTDFRKKELHEQYNIPLYLSKDEMMKKANYDKIWNCGLIKFVWKSTIK